ncbi:MAG: hypothetical protein EXQ97_04530 [Alphaproteobacteria bacterium]|nr:hypothetical protein [Alphaproteobacteria bacterium]
MAPSERPWRPVREGLAVRVRVTPRARRAGAGGTIALPDVPALRVAVTAPPAEGAANAAVLALLAAACDVPKSALAVTLGTSGRLRAVTVSGDPSSLAARLEAWLTHAEGVSA